MEWWVYGPLIMAIIMFLLVGTLFERRIEAAIRRFMDIQHEQLNQREATVTTESDRPASDSIKANPPTSISITKSTQSLTNPPKPTPSYTASPIHPIIKSSKHSILRSSSQRNLSCERNATVILNKSMPKIHA